MSTVTHFMPSPENQVGEYLYQTPLKGLLYIQHKQFPDDRGFYSEITRVPELEDYLKLSFHVQQVNLSHSKQNVTRGIHAENWNKLLTVTTGEIFGAWADLRTDSPTFGDVVTISVGPNAPETFGSLFVSSGIGNSFCVVKGPVDYLYAVDELYSRRDPSGDVAISVFDTDLAIPWPIAQSEMLISERDKTAISLREAFPGKVT